MRIRRPLVGVGVLLLGIGATVALGRRRHRRWARNRSTSLRSLAGTAQMAGAETETDAALPDPVSRYFAHVLPDDRNPVAARIGQRGDLRLGDQSSAWHSFTATHHLATNPPGFLWDARIRLAPGVWVTVADEYRRGKGSTRVRLLSTIPLGGGDQCAEVNEAALMRQLAEGPWCPTSLLPRAGVSWKAIDDRSAQATIRDGTTEATLVFHFTEHDEIERVSTEARYRAVPGGFEPTPWTGHWGSYRQFDGIRIPTAGEVVWHLPDGDLHAWRGSLTDVEFFD